MFNYDLFFEVLKSLLVWLLATASVYSFNVITDTDGSWDKLSRTALVEAGVFAILMISGAEFIFTEFSFILLLARLDGFFWGYWIADSLWQKSDKYIFGIREELDD